MASVLNSIGDVIREDLSFMERALEPKVDGWFTKVYTTSEGVVRGGGRAAAASSTGWEVLHTFSTGVAGAFRNLPAGGDDITAAANTGTVTKYSPNEAFPSIAETTAPGYVQRTLTLVQGLGNFALPLHLVQSEQLDSTIAKPVSLTIRGTAKQIAQVEANSMYSVNEIVAGTPNAAVVHVLDDASAVVADGPTSTKSLTITLGTTAQSTGRIGQIYPGMQLDLIDVSGSYAKLNTAQLVVGNVDYIGGSYSVYDVGNNDLLAASVGDGDYFVQWNSDANSSGAGYGPTGFEGFLKTGATDSVYGIDIADYGQFRSLADSGNTAMSEIRLNTAFGTFFDAYGDLCDLDTVIMTNGALTGLINDLSAIGSGSVLRWNRQGEKLNGNLGWTAVSYGYNGRAIDIMTSRYIRKGVAYAFKAADQNLKRYVPPRIPAAGSKEGYNNEIQWWAPMTGSSSIFLPGRGSSAELVQYMEAPFFCFREIAPDQVQGIVFTNIIEDF